MKVSLNARSNQEALEQLRDVKEKLLQFNSLEPVVNRLDQFFFSLQQIINSLYTQDSFADIASILDFLLVALTIADFDVLPYWESLVDPLVALVKINELKSTAESVLCRISRDSLAKAEILSKLRHKQQYTQDRQLIDDINGMILRIDRVTPKSYPHRALRRTSSLNYSSSDTYDSASPVSKEAELDLHSENSASNVDQRVLSISILPHSLKENWMLTTDEEELICILEEVLNVYELVDANVRLKASKDASIMIDQCLKNLSIINYTLQLQGMRLLHKLILDHPRACRPSYPDLFLIAEIIFRDSSSSLHDITLTVVATISIQMEFGELASNLLMLNMRKSSRQTFMMIGSLGILKLALQCYTSVVDQGWAFLKQPVLQLARFGLDDLAERSGKIVIEDLESDSAIDLVGTSVLALHKLSSGSPSPTNHRHQIRIEQWFKEISSYHEIKPSPEESHKIVTRAGTMMFPSIMNNRVLSDFVDNLIEAPYGAQSDHRYDNAHIEPNSTFNINSSSYMSKQSDRVSTADSLSSYPSQFPDEVNNHETSSADSADYEHAKKHLVNQIGSRDSYLDDRQIKGPGSYSGSDTGASNYVPSILLPTENVDVAPNAKSPVTSGPGGEGGRHIGGRIGGRTSRIVHNSTLEGELDLSLTGKAIDPSMKKSDFNSSFGWESQQLQSGETLELKEYAFKDASVDHSKLRTLKQKKLSFSKSSNSKTRPNENNTEDNKVSDRVVNTSDGTRSIAYQDLDYEKSSFDSPNNGFYTPNVVAKYNNDGKRMQELRMQDRTPPRARGRRSRVLSKDNLASETSSVENDDLEDMTDSISVISYHSATSAVSTRERSTDGGHYASYKNSQGENNTTVKIPRKLLGAGSKQNSMNRAPAIPENGSPGTSTEALNYDFGGKGKLDMRLASCDSYDSTATSPAKSSRSLHNTPKRLISKRFSTGSSTSTPTNESMDQLLLSPRAPSPFDFSTSETPITPLTSSHRKSSRRSLQLNTSIEDTNSSSTSHDPISPRSKSDNFDYLAAEDMLPCHNPTQELSKALHGLENHEWPDIFHTITSVRKISIHHQVVLLDSGSLHSVVRLLNKQADNLRSQVVKNALLAVGELFNNLGKHMDVEINTLIGVILKRCGDSSQFLAESADNAMYCMILKASGMRTLSALLLHVDHKNPIVRGKVATFLLALLSHKGKDLLGTKELDLLKSKLGKILQDQSPVARSSGRSVVRVLIENNYATTADLENYISIDLIQKALKDPHSQSGFNLSELKATTSFHDKAGSPMRAMPLQSLSPRKSRGKVYEGFSGVASKERDPSPSPFKRSIVRNISTESAIKDQRDSPFRPSNKLAKERDMQLESFSMASEVDSHNIGLSLSPSASMAELAALSSTPVHKVPKSPRGNRKEVKISNSQSAAKRAMETNSELLNLQQLLQSTTVSSWSERKSAIEELKELLLKHKVVLLDSGKMSSCIDHILNRVEDGNVKVAIFAVTCLEEINKEDSSLLHQNLFTITSPALLSCAASTNRQISQRSTKLLLSLYHSDSPSQVVDYLCRTMQHDHKEKCKLSSIKLLQELLPSYCVDEDLLSVLIRKSLFPTLCNLLFGSNTKGDVRVAVTDTIKVLHYNCRKEKIWSWCTDSKQIEEIRRICSIL